MCLALELHCVSVCTCVGLALNSQCAHVTGTEITMRGSINQYCNHVRVCMIGTKTTMWVCTCDTIGTEITMSVHVYN